MRHNYNLKPHPSTVVPWLHTRSVQTSTGLVQVVICPTQRGYIPPPTRAQNTYIRVGELTLPCVMVFNRADVAYDFHFPKVTVGGYYNHMPLKGCTSPSSAMLSFHLGRPPIETLYLLSIYDCASAVAPMLASMPPSPPETPPASQQPAPRQGRVPIYRQSQTKAKPFTSLQRSGSTTPTSLVSSTSDSPSHASMDALLRIEANLNHLLSRVTHLESRIGPIQHSSTATEPLDVLSPAFRTIGNLSQSSRQLLIHIQPYRPPPFAALLQPRNVKPHDVKLLKLLPRLMTITWQAMANIKTYARLSIRTNKLYKSGSFPSSFVIASYNLPDTPTTNIQHFPIPLLLQLKPPPINTYTKSMHPTLTTTTTTYGSLPITPPHSPISTPITRTIESLLLMKQHAKRTHLPPLPSVPLHTPTTFQQTHSVQIVIISLNTNKKFFHGPFAPQTTISHLIIQTFPYPIQLPPHTRFTYNNSPIIPTFLIKDLHDTINEICIHLPLIGGTRPSPHSSPPPILTPLPHQPPNITKIVTRPGFTIRVATLNCNGCLKNNPDDRHQHLWDFISDYKIDVLFLIDHPRTNTCKR